MSAFSLHPYRGLQGGDVVQFWVHKNGLANERVKQTGAVNPMLVFEHHVVVNKGFCGTVVCDNNFIKLVRRARRQS